MPRDLFSSDTRDDNLVASPESQSRSPEASDLSSGTGGLDYNALNAFIIHRDESRNTSIQQSRENRARGNKGNGLHPYVQTLSISNLASCVELENAVFPELERCSREKFVYRLTKCPELCLGLFTTKSSDQSTSSDPTYSTALASDSASPQSKSVLIAMIIATKTTSPVVTDECMEFPRDWRSVPSQHDESSGHQDYGRTICIQTLGVLPSYQGKGLGKTLMKSYQQRMETSGAADRVALLAHDHLIKMYEGMGFEAKGKSDVNFGGGGWNNLVYEFSEHLSGP